MRFLELTPLDVFTVRDARPFDVGGVVHATSVWPPPPWTILGALRGLMVEALGFSVVDYAHRSGGNGRWKEVVERVGPPDGAAAFAIGPALLAAKHEQKHSLRWPVPADLLSYENPASPGKKFLRRLRAVERTAFPAGTSCSLAQSRPLVLLPPAEQALHAEKSLSVTALHRDSLIKWLNGEDKIEVSNLQEENQSKEPPGDDVAWKPRIGIQLDPDRHTVREGRFYVRQMTALGQGRSILVPLVDERGLPWDELKGQCVRLGADSHLARVDIVDGPDLLPQAGKGIGKRARLLTLAPLHPADVDALAHQGREVKAVAARRGVRVGGWQLAHEASRWGRDPFALTTRQARCCTSKGMT